MHIDIYIYTCLKEDTLKRTGFILVLLFFLGWKTLDKTRTMETGLM